MPSLLGRGRGPGEGRIRCVSTRASSVRASGHQSVQSETCRRGPAGEVWLSCFKEEARPFASKFRLVVEETRVG